MSQSPAFTLYYASRVCSLAPHIVLRELGVALELVRVDLRGSRDALLAATPKNYVPALRLPDGEMLTETAVILRYLADAHPAAELAPPHGTFARVRFDEALHFIATELHKGFAPFTIMAAPSAESKQWAAARLAARVAVIDQLLGDRRHLHGDRFTVLDAYAFWALRNYAALTGQPLSPALRAYVDAIAERPSVRAALDAER